MDGLFRNMHVLTFNSLEWEIADCCFKTLLPAVRWWFFPYLFFVVLVHRGIRVPLTTLVYVYAAYMHSKRSLFKHIFSAFIYFRLSQTL